MKIIKDKATKIVIFIGSSLTLDSHAKGDGWESKRITPVNSVLEDVSENVPNDYASGLYIYDNGWILSAAGISADSTAQTQTFSKQKQVKTVEITEAAMSAIRENIVHNTFTFTAKQEDQDLLVAVLSAGSVPAGMYWRDSSGTAQTMSYADLQGLSSAIVTRGLGIDTTLQAKLAEIEAATDESELDAITFD
ncbi:hypothetical protein [uncultured Paraglaciecola sp.]|uniref:DUF4376 domain-containing protein n=1 Tax=uncultured Paraglaciecola sp. TaxID=1765024 RepID=UPI002631FF03|nr:hypothetical protein [uncultured Paraglaciecola sp.]